MYVGIDEETLCCEPVNNPMPTDTPATVVKRLARLTTAMAFFFKKKNK